MKLIWTMVMLVVGCLTVAADSPYYYCKGKKIPLTEMSGMVTMSLPATTAVTSSLFYSVEREIIDEAFRVMVCSQGDSRLSANSFSSALKSTHPDVLISPCYRSENGGCIAVTPYLNVMLRDEADFPYLHEAAREHSLTIVSQDRFMPQWYILSVTAETDGTSLDIANRLYETGLFEEAIADFSSDNDLLCSYDPLITEQWGLYNPDHAGVDISVCGAWDYATGRGIKIGILDNGVDIAHTDLSANISSLSFDTESGTSPAKLYGDHGTHCAGIAAAVRNNGIQVAGVAPDAKIVSISNSLATSTNSRLKRADGIVWAYKNGIDIISNSWGSTTEHAAINNAIADALKYGREGKGCIVVFAAGNEGNDIPVAYPANCNDKIIAVGAISSTGVVPSFSQTGDKLDVVAPGVDILSTIPGNATDYKDGTSMACPHVAAVAALILERNPALTVTQVSDIIEKNTKKVGGMRYNEKRKNGTWNSYYGYGLVDAESALRNTPRP